MKINGFMLTMFTLFLISYTYSQTAEEAINLLEDEQGVGIKATAMGNAFTAVADDYSAIYWNPAGLAQLKRGELNMAIYNQKYKSEAQYREFTTEDNQSFTKLHNFGFAYPFPVMRGSFVVAFGYQKTKDLDNVISFGGYNPNSNGLGFEIDNSLGNYGVLPFDLGLEESQTISNEGNISQWSAAAAIDLSPNFSAGMTLNFYGGRSEYSNAYSQDDVYENNSYDIYNENNEVIEYFYYNYYDVLQKVYSEYSGFEMKIGGLYKFMNFFQVGGTITFPMELKIKEEWSVSDELSYDVYSINENIIYETVDPAVIGGGSFDYLIEVPFKFSIGAAFKSQFLTLSGSAEYRDWTQMKFAVPEDRYEDEYEDLLSHNKLFRENFKETINLSVGAEVNFMDVSFRGGLRYVQSPLKNDVLRDFDKYYVSAGAGLQVSENVILEGSYTIGLWDKRNNYNYDWEAPGPMKVTEKHSSNRLLLGARLFF